MGRREGDGEKRGREGKNIEARKERRKRGGKGTEISSESHKLL